MSALRQSELWPELHLRSEQDPRASRRREALRVVRQHKLRAQLHLLPQQDASARPWRKQVHLVRLDGEWRQLHLFADASPREVAAQRGFSASCSRRRNQHADGAGSCDRFTARRSCLHHYDVGVVGRFVPSPFTHCVAKGYSI